jgi:hypothetical protein
MKAIAESLRWKGVLLILLAVPLPANEAEEAEEPFALGTWKPSTPKVYDNAGFSRITAELRLNIRTLKLPFGL